MQQVALFFAAVLPGLLVLAYGVAKTRIGWRNEALYTAVLAGAVGGVLAGIPGPALEKLFPVESAAPLVRAGVEALVFAAIPEEGIKFLILLGAVRRDANVRRLQDIVALALGVALGFAMLENLLYVFGDRDWRTVALGRSLSAVPSHGIDGLIMGALLTSARLRAHRQRSAYVIALAVPVSLHAAYDFPPSVPVQGQELWLIVVWFALLLMSVVLAICLCNRVLPRAAEADRMAGRDTVPPLTAEHLVVGGYALLIAGPLLGVLLFQIVGFPLVWAGAAFGIFPAALGIDLMRTGLSRRKLATGSVA